MTTPLLIFYAVMLLLFIASIGKRSLLDRITYKFNGEERSWFVFTGWIVPRALILLILPALGTQPAIGLIYGLTLAFLWIKFLDLHRT